MIRASRRNLFPRKVVRPINGWFSSSCLLLFVGLLALWSPAFATIIAFLVLVTSMLTWRGCRHHRAVANRRADESICTFVRGFDYRRIDTLVVRAVYDELQPWHKFSLRASDGLETDLRVDSDDLDWEIAPMVAERTRRSLDNSKDNPYFGKVRTVADLVNFFCLQPMQAAKPSPGG